MTDLAFHTTRFENILLIGTISLMLVFPTQLMFVKLLFIFILLFFSISKKRYVYIGKSIRPIYALIYCYGIWGVSTGLLQVNDNSEILARLPLLFLHPLLYFFLIPFLAAQNNINRCEKLIVFCHCILLFVNFYNILAAGFGFQVISLAEDDVYIFGEDSVGIGAKNLHQLIFTIPFVFAVGFFGKRKWFIPVWLLTMLLVAISTRGALIMVTLLSLMTPLIVAIVFNRGKKNTILFYLFTIFIILTILSVVIQNIYFEFILNNFLDHFDPDADYERYNQREVLISAWESSPISGVGWGTSIDTGYAGKITAFESTYHAVLAYTGIVGFLFFISYLALTIVFLYKKLKETRSLFILACFSGCLCSVICASTNPVLSTFDRLLSLYLAIGCIACKFLKGSYHEI